MATAWIDPIRQRKQLTVQLGQGVTGEWLSIVESAINTFNHLSRQHALNVSFQVADSSADVDLLVADGHVSFQCGTFITSGRFDGKRLHGLTRFLRKGQRIERALVLLPMKPTTGDDEAHRLVGRHVRKLIAIHELIHACGLDQSDHAPGDLFQAYPAVENGESPGGDRVCCELRNGRRRAMPPIILNDRTITKLRQLW